MRSLFATHRVYVRLSEQDVERLRNIARAERRDPREQAAVLLSEALRKHEQGAAEVRDAAN